MTLNEYQEQAQSTAIYPKEHSKGLLYAVLKLNGEAGEVAELLGKALRDDGGSISGKFDDFVKELGDVLWYVAAVAENLGIDLEYVAQQNIEKLQSRYQRGVIKGSGNNR